MPETTNQITHRNHYVPEFYLKNWSEDGKTVYVYSLLVPDKSMPYWSKKSIKYTAVWNDFYTRNEGEKQVDDFERWFNKEFETPSRNILDKLLHDQSISDDESKRLTRYIMAQHLRTPARLFQILDLHKRIVPKAIEKSMRVFTKRKSDEKSTQHDKIQMPVGVELQPIKAKVNKEENQIEVQTLIGRGSYLFSLKYLLTETVKKIENHKWYVIHAADGIQFPTSDDPVICMNYNNNNDYSFHGGWNKKHGNILFPISPAILLFTEIGSPLPPERLDYSIQWSQFFRRIIIEHAHRYVYAYKKQKGMLAINARIGNKDLYEKEKLEMTGWYDEQTLHEREYE